MFRKSLSRCLLAAACVGLLPAGAWAQVLIQETFEDAAYTGRGWYDTTGGALSTVEKFAGASSYECRFPAGATNCVGGDIGRHKIAGSTSIYIAYYVKHSANWVGSGTNFHPHMFMFLTNENVDYAGPAYTHLTAYVENNYLSGGAMWFSVQDGQNIDETKIGVDLTATTENRAVGGCNGDSDGYGNGTCYLSGSVHWNGKTWPSTSGFFDSTTGSAHYKGTWHLVEAYFQMNSIAGGIGQKDGIVRYWYDGALVMEHTNVVIRTGAHPQQVFNQVDLIPYIGVGSPVDQTMWIDNLLIATARPASPPPPPGGIPAPRPPTNVRIIR